MHTFLLDLWHDLREKRLWPVAALLMVGIAAVPFVLLEEEQPAPTPATPPATAQTAADKLPTIALEDAATSRPSNLNQFRQRNPFKSLADLPKSDAPGGDENKTVNLGASPRADKATASASAKGGSSSGGGSPAKTSGGSPGGSGSGAGSYVGPRTTYYTYRADIHFGVVGKAKSMKQVEAFTLLGDDKEPAAMFMGVTDDHDYAVFAVDTARFQAEGEHDCKPSPERCEFVYLETGEDGNETTFTTLDGTKSYDLKLDAIKRIVLDKKDVEDVPTEGDKAGKATREKRAKADPEPRSLFDVLARRR